MKYLFPQKNVILIILVFLIVGCKSQKFDPKKEINILFIGNSLTYYNDMPQTVQKMLAETHPNYKVEQSTFPGMSLTQHLSTIIVSKTGEGIVSRKKIDIPISKTEIKIASKKWDIIILQEGTVRLLIDQVREYRVETAISEIKKLANNPNCKFILFKTWPNKRAYPKKYCYSKDMINRNLEYDRYCSPVMGNLKEEVSLINTSYNSVAKKLELLKSENTNKVYQILKNYPKIEVYEDDIHPNKYGSFLNACVFYKLLTNTRSSGVNYIGDIEKETAKILKKIADK